MGLPGAIKPKKVQERKKEDRNPILSFKPLDPAMLEAGETTLNFLVSSANEFPYWVFCCCCFLGFLFFGGFFLSHTTTHMLMTPKSTPVAKASLLSNRLIEITCS